jgi:hypothetical protein
MDIRLKPLKAIVSGSPKAGMNSINLEKFYNISLQEEVHGKPGNLLPVEPGLAEFNGQLFDIRGIIQLSSSVSEEKTHIFYPKEVIEIPIQQLAEKLCFIHSSAWESKKGEKVVDIIVNYADGTSQNIDIKYQLDVEDWWFFIEKSIFPVNCQSAWKGSNDRVKDLNCIIQLYQYTWINPQPQVEIESIDLLSAMNGTGYMLYALNCL